jgi:D-amino-acid dehydrogenase
VTDRADVLVIGGGFAGVCSAHYLARRGKTVTLVERGDIASGCSSGNAGLIVPSHSLPMAAPGALARGFKWMFDPESPFYIKPRLSPALFSWLWKFRAACTEERARRSMAVLRDLHRASLALYDELAKLDGLAFGYAREGLLLLYRTDHGLEEGLQEAKLLGEAGIGSKTLSPSEVTTRVPHARSGLAGGILFPGDAHLDPASFVRGLAACCEAGGVQLRCGVEVLGFETSGRKITSVRTSRGDVAADQFVLATGSWSPSVARGLGLKIPIQPAKGYSITLRRPESCPPLPLLLMESKVAVTPLCDRMRLAGTMELAGLDLSINERRVEAIRRGAREYLDGLDGMESGEVWRGLRPCTPDGLPILGRSRAFENLILATGHAMVGVSLGPVTGSLVAQMACGVKPDIDLAALSPERF